MWWPLVRLLPVDPKLNFVGWRFIFFGFSLFMVLGSAVLVMTKGLNYGVDFRGGIVIEVQTDGSAELDVLRTQLNALGLGDVTLQTFGADDVLLINVPRQDGEESAQQEAIDQVRASLGDYALEYRRVEAVGPKVGDELRSGAIIATILSLTGIAIYVWVRFDLNYALTALASLIHDVVATVGFFALTGLEFNLSALAAVLTVAGYSINDTVVIYDRVREELRRYKKLPIHDVLNKSINQTFVRTAMTSATTFLALLGLAFFGGEVIRGFAAGIIFGVVVGTYSTWGVAVPLLSYTRLRATEAPPKDGAEGKGGAASKA